MEWINVKDKIPNKGDRVLAYYNNTGIQLITFMGKDHEFFKYWMPLPSQPAE